MKFYYGQYRYRLYKGRNLTPRLKFYAVSGFLGIHGRVGWGIREQTLITAGIVW